MHLAELHCPYTEDALAAAVRAACAAIAPVWPLDRFIAVNPHWGRVDRPFADYAGTLARLSGSSLWMPAAYYRRAWQSGQITVGHLQTALEASGLRLTHADLLAALDDDAVPPALPLLSDVLDASRDLTHAPAWREVITHQISQFCAAFFDVEQADWHPPAAGGLYARWRASIGADHGIVTLMHVDALRARAAALPAEPQALFGWAAARLAAAPEQLDELFQVALLRINGWAAWCAYQGWEARLAGKDDPCIEALLAIRLAWECLLDDGQRGPDSAWAAWQRQWAACPPPSASVLAVWQAALERAYQTPLIAALAAHRPPPQPALTAQAVFCIDVRSEVLRRALETVAPSVQTLGFAGFFGLPLEYRPIGTAARRPQLPGLLAPALAVTEHAATAATGRDIAQRRHLRLAAHAAWRPFARLPGAAFGLVESLGPAYAAKIVRRSLPHQGRPAAPHHAGLRTAELRALRPQLCASAADTAVRVELAAQILPAMGLASGWARVVLLVGHGSQSANNAHAAGLDCGACGGQSGELNARALAALLNGPEVRAGLGARGLELPASTHFVAAEHNTTTDEVVCFDRDAVPATHTAELATLEAALAAAGARARAERAAALGVGDLRQRPQALLAALRRRANDWAQTRPEWGLANNAALIIAPRGATLGLDLGGRVFLHDYCAGDDPDGSLLERIMTAPMVVAHWINLQYYASCADPLRYGSGNKLLHNVVGGRIGVFEGNGGDLRIGLPWQSVHDGSRFVHTPLRLSVFIAAPRAAIEAVLARHALVRNLVCNRWLSLFRLEAGGVEAYAGGTWHGATP